MNKVQQLFTGTLTRNQTLEKLPGRALTLIKGIAKSADIHKAMEGAGYTIEVQKQGFALLESACGFGIVAPAGEASNPAGEAIQEVSDWFAPAFDRTQAALEHLHPAQAAYVFGGLVSVRGVASVIAAALFLDRLDDLAGTGSHAEARKASADEDKKAMATLALRGFDAKELARVRGLVDVAHAATAGEPAPAPATDEQEQRLLALKAWYDDWSTTARALFTKRGDLIKLGLAHPRATAPADPVVPPPVAPAPGTPPAAPHA